MRSEARLEAFIDSLVELPQLPGVFNPWRDFDPQLDIGSTAPDIRRQNLIAYLRERPRAKLVLIGEAPGYRGCRFSGIAMTSERILLGAQPRIAPESVFLGPKHRSSAESVFPHGAIEPTASIVWSLMLELAIDPRSFILWNSFPCHPHKHRAALTNRAPTPAELDATRHILPQLIALSPGARLVAVGRVAERSLAALGLTAEVVRHPAMGGANAFRSQISRLISSKG